MIIARLSGGLGNQMFQYAAARRLACAHGAALKLDISGLEKTSALDTFRKYALPCFTIKAALATYRECEVCDELQKKAHDRVFRILHKFGFFPSKSGLHYYREQRFSFDGRVLKLPDNVCLDGFWQSEKYFMDISDTIRDEFTLVDGLAGMNLRIADQIAACNSVSLHIRRGDYFTNPAAALYHGTCAMDYYSRAVEEIKKRVDRPHLFVISDDPEWSAMHIKFDIPTKFIGHNDVSKGGEDMRLMSLCRHNIVANSSFSWWGAWLNRNPDKIVIAPVRWFANLEPDTSDLIPHGWIRL